MAIYHRRILAVHGYSKVSIILLDGPDIRPSVLN